MRDDVDRRVVAAVLLFLAGAAGADAQDQQLGARTKGMGGSYTAFEDDPVSVWLNPAGIATQPDGMGLVYQTYTAYPVDQERGPSDTIVFSVEPETVLAPPGFFPSYLGFVFALGSDESPLAVGLCVARPYHLNYAMDQITGPTQTSFTPDSNVEQDYLRFRVACAKDFLFSPPGTAGLFTHVSVGLALDAAYEQWHFTGPSADRTDTGTGFGFGVGALVCLYDDTESLKVNLGLAYQSAVEFDFDIEPDLLPAFDMPQQFNVGLTLYLLPGLPLRVTADLQWIEWSETAEPAVFGGFPAFEDAVNLSIGVEYRFKASDKVSVLPRAGLRRFDAPWDDPDNLPSTGAYKLVLDTGSATFPIATLGVGLAWTTAEGKSRSVDLGIDFGGDSFNVAVGYTHEW